MLTTGDSTTYRYDALGRLEGAELADDTAIDYVVDPLGRRVGKKRDGQLVQGFLYGGAVGPTAEFDGNGQLRSRFVYGASLRVPEYFTRGGSRYRILTDHLGSPRKVVDMDTGDVVQEMDYDAFGNVTRDTQPGFQPFGFAGGLYDRDTGLVHFGAREYDPRIGRWTSRDPLGFDGGDSNLYAYVLSDPVNLIDPGGTEIDWPSPDDALQAVTGAADAVSEAVADTIETVNVVPGINVDVPTFQDIREDLGIDWADYCSNWYKGAKTVTTVAMYVVPAAAAVRASTTAVRAVRGVGGLRAAAPKVAKRVQDGIKRRSGGRRSTTPNPRQPGTDIVPKSTYSLGKWGEARLAQVLDDRGFVPKNYLKTNGGKRRKPDRIVDGVGHESKAGVNVKLTSGHRRQIDRDAQLISEGRLTGAYWHFWQGAQDDIKAYLTQKGIPFRDYVENP